MKNVALIDTNNYFVESRKAIQIALEKERDLYNQIPKEEKLRLLRKRKAETNSVEEYEAIEIMEKQLEKEIKFNGPVPLVPDEYKDVIKKNVEIEAAEYTEKLNELRKELKIQLPYLQDVVLPLLINIHELKKMKNVPSDVEFILDSQFIGQTAISAKSVIQRGTSKRKNKLIDDLQEIIRSIDFMSV